VWTRRPEVKAVNRILGLAAVALLSVAVPLAASAQDDRLRSDFAAIIQGLNDNTFGPFHEAINEREFTGRILGTRVIDDDAKRYLASDFRGIIERSFAAAFPPPRNEDEAGSEILGTIVAFDADNGRARALVRFEARGFRYSFHAYDLVLRGSNVRIVDWFDFYQGAWFSEQIGNALLRMVPTQASVASILDVSRPSQGQLFQVGELLKAARDSNMQRFFQIRDGLEEALRMDPFVVSLNYEICRRLGDPARLQGAVGEIVETFPNDARFSLSLAEYYVQRRRFDDAIVEFGRLEESLGHKDAVIESLKATAAMALGDFERAEALAVSATEVDPSHELSWWTLLRTRTAAKDYAGAVEAMTVLEERFGELLIPQTLRRDRFLRVLIDQPEYQEWRAARDAA
jgi:tetratricopeptide (TPR) repeat protein